MLYTFIHSFTTLGVKKLYLSYALWNNNDFFTTRYVKMVTLDGLFVTSAESQIFVNFVLSNVLVIECR